MKEGVLQNHNGNNGNQEIRDGCRPQEPSGPQTNGIPGSDDLLSVRIENLLTEYGCACRTAAAKASARWMWQVGIGVGIGLAGAAGYWLYVMHTGPSFAGALSRSPLLITIEAFALRFLRRSDVDREKADQFTAKANHVPRLLAQYLLTKEYGNRETMLAFAEALGKEVELLAGKTRIEISKQRKDTCREQA